MSNQIITGNISTTIEYDLENGGMICRHKSEFSTKDVPFEILLRAYVSLGAQIHKINQKGRYGIENEEDNKRVVEELKRNFGEDE